jgi:hypothetical protein
MDKSIIHSFDENSFLDPCTLNGNALTVQEFEDKITLLNYMTMNLVVFTSMSSRKDHSKQK